MIKIMWQAIIPAIASVASAAISAGASAAAINKRNEAQKREQEMAYRRERQSIREMNSFNSTSAQMARLQAAGLNPNLMYQNGQQAAAGEQSEIPHYQPADIESTMTPMGSAGQQMINSLVSLQDMKNKTMLAESEAMVNSSTAGVNWSSVRLNDAQSNEIYSLLGLRKQEIEARVNQINSETKLNESTASEIMERVKNYWWQRAEMRASISKMTAEEYCMRALLPSQIELNKMTSDEKAAAILKSYEEMRYIGAYYYLDVDKLEFEKYKVENQNEQNHFDRRAQYWDMGLRTGVQILGLATSIVTKGGAMSNLFSGNVWNRSSQQTFGSPMNSPSQLPSTPWYNSQHPKSKRYGR